VTLTRTGGIGKTRLAVQVASGLTDEFPDGLWWVGLAPVSSGEVLGAIAQVLGVREDEGTALERALLVRLEGRRMLIVLDNAEHLLPDLADVVVRLLAADDRLVVLATSRERLQLSAEHVHPVPPLANTSCGPATSIDCTPSKATKTTDSSLTDPTLAVARRRRQ
jgi:predicted ATPase